MTSQEREYHRYKAAAEYDLRRLQAELDEARRLLAERTAECDRLRRQAADRRWTKQPPTVDGWYWWREDISRRATIVRWPLPAPGGEWWGPLSEPGGDAVENCRSESLAEGAD